MILIDNGSVDVSADFVKEEYPEVTVKCFAKNQGFCGAVNEGIRMTETKYVILLNNDTIAIRSLWRACICDGAGERLLCRKFADGSDAGPLQDGQLR